jgi:hypothetical protein
MTILLGPIAEITSDLNLGPSGGANIHPEKNKTMVAGRNKWKVTFSMRG